jgi:hypothetical protein
MRAVAAGNERRPAGVGRAIRPFQPRRHDAASFRKIQQLDVAFDGNSRRGEAVDQQLLVFVLRKQQRVWIRADACAHRAEHGVCGPPSGDPHRYGHRGASPCNDRLGEANLAYSSSVRACTATARDVVDAAAFLSTMRTRTPSRVSHSASTSPVGPAPTTRTSVSRLVRSLIGLPAGAGAGLLDKRL